MASLQPNLMLIQCLLAGRQPRLTKALLTKPNTAEDIICHRGAKNAKGDAPVAAGDIVHLQWNGWLESHKGLVMDYLASAQNYPQCINLQIAGNGSDLPSGILGKELYDPSDPSIHLDIYKGVSTYMIPGPAPIAGAETVTLSHPLPTGSGMPFTGTIASIILAPTPTTADSGRMHPRFIGYGSRINSEN
ncbi:hypothetical protein F5Y06DRAFT_299972 [Hypoxylon sp. FL0890]|nr:hypothetical protein F5Y06DRAFT_299972 [Hypoxylon sp. FL0890]